MMVILGSAAKGAKKGRALPLFLYVEWIKAYHCQ
jgi:hypothetical protein